MAAQPGSKAFNKLIPYVIPPENITPAVWQHYATTCRECPAGCGLYLRVTDGRPINARGNPGHPISRGGVCARGHSIVQGLYDPDRLQQVLLRKGTGQTAQSTWDQAITEIAGYLKESQGHVVLISDLHTGALVEVMKSFMGAFGSATVPTSLKRAPTQSGIVVPIYQYDRLIAAPRAYVRPF